MSRPLFQAAGFFVLRTPLLPFAEWQQFGEGLEGAAAAGAVTGPALVRDRETLVTRIRALAGRPEIREALFVASPSLVAALDEGALEGPEPDAKVVRSIVRYLARMAGRPTPFGLFAGCSVGRVRDRTRLAVGALPEARRHTRPDMDYLFALSNALARSPALRPALPHRPNATLYRVGNQWRFVEARVQGKHRQHQLVAAQATVELDATIARARRGAGPVELAEALVKADPTGEISPDDASGYIEELIEAQVLRSSLEVSVTGREPVHVLIEQLTGLPGGRQAAEALATFRDLAGQLDRSPLGTATHLYPEMRRALDGLPVKAEPARLFQVDLVKPGGATLGSKVVGELTRGVELLHRLTVPATGGPLERFRQDFRRRFDGRTVRLVDALDEETGIGFDRTDRGSEDAPLLAGLLLQPAAAEVRAPWGNRESLLLAKLDAAARAGASEILLEAIDLEALETKEPPPLPDAFCAFATLLAKSQTALDQGEFRVLLRGVGGPSGARLLGRFCHGDPQLEALVAAHLRAEEACRPEAVFAEIVHLPEGRVGNVLCRPVLRDHEIPLLGASGAPEERQIPLTDLLVGVEGDRIVLRSQRLGREVLPRLSNAHNFAGRGLGLYRFLGHLQSQGHSASLGWSWGALGAAPFLPRVRVGRWVLSRASWNLGLPELERLDRASPFDSVRRLRALRGLPRWVALQDGDHELPLDLDNILSVETFVGLVGQRPHATLIEQFPDDLCAESPEGKFTHELIVPFAKAPEAARAPSRQPRPGSGFGRPQVPGSSCLYAKIYAGTAAADRILTEVLPRVVGTAIASGAAVRWFFIRYGDPDSHLRVRFFGDPHRLHTEVFPAVHAACTRLIEGQDAWKFQLDTYEPETERYAGPVGLGLAERWFHADSDAVLDVLSWLRTAPNAADARWRLALRGMDLVFDDFGIGLERRAALVRRARGTFDTEFQAGLALTATLGARYRKESRALESMLEREAPSFLRERSVRCAAIAQEFMRAEAEGRLWMPVEAIIPSLLHMFANRLFRAEARAQEFVLYDFLARLYESRLARQRGRRRAS